MQHSTLFQEFSRFHTNMFFMDNKPTIFKQHLENLEFCSKRVAEVSEAMAEEYDKQKQTEVKQAKAKISEEFKTQYQITIEEKDKQIEDLLMQVQNMTENNNMLNNETVQNNAELDRTKEELKKTQDDCAYHKNTNEALAQKYEELEDTNEKLKEENKNKDMIIEDLE